jgi:1-phosphofructokinase
MIYTVTFNPAIDYLVYVPELKVGSIIRSEKEKVFCGGKGINVSLVLRELGIKSTAMGFIAGFTGSAIEQAIGGDEISTDFVHLNDGLTRINVKIRSGYETDINGQGPAISENDIKLLFDKLKRLKQGDTLVLAGSIPNTLPSDIYEKIMELLSETGVRFVVDATKDLLLNSLKYLPFLIKPNNDELGEIFGVKIDTPEDAILYAGKLRKMGAVNVLVSMGKNGAVLVDENDKEYYMPAIDGKVINTVGAGDSMVAGFLAGYAQKADYDYALRLGSAAGGATAFSEGLATRDEIFRLMNQIQSQ